METAADKLQFELAGVAARPVAGRGIPWRKAARHGRDDGQHRRHRLLSERNAACFAVLHYVNGSLLDKEYEILATADDPKEAVSSLVKQFYLVRGRGAQGHSDAV